MQLLLLLKEEVLESSYQKINENHPKIKNTMIVKIKHDLTQHICQQSIEECIETSIKLKN